MEYDITMEKKEAKGGCLRMSKTSLFWLAILVLTGALTALTVLMVKIDRNNKSIIESLFPLTMRTCELNGQTFKDGESFIIDSCGNTCTCYNGQAGMCTGIGCFEDYQEFQQLIKASETDEKKTSTERAPSTTESLVLCPKGFFNKGNLCYFFSYKKKTWSAAAQHCRDLDAYLAEPRTPWEVYFLKSLSSKRRRSVWLGATDQAVEGKWVWAQSGEDVDGLTDWYYGQPDVNGSGEDCMEINHDLGGKWNDVPCDQRKLFICQKEVTTKNIGALQCLPPDSCLGSTKYLCIKCNTGRKRTKCNPIILDRFKTVMKTRPALTDSQVMSDNGEFSCLASVHEEAFDETPAYYIAVEFYNPNYIGTSQLMRLGKGDDDSFY